MSYLNIYIIICVIMLCIESIVMMLKITNITTTSYDNYYIILLGITNFKKYNILFCIMSIIMIVSIVRTYKREYSSYKILNVVNENLVDIDLIIKKYLKEGNDIELENNKNSIILKFPLIRTQELKPMLKEINHYLRSNGKATPQIKIRVAVLSIILIVSVFIGF